MIVKNEGKFLNACLQSVQQFVDEIVIVDTGSTDTTIAIAQQYNAKIFHFAWNGNFSDARNESLRHCSGDWILFLDADERLERNDVNALRLLLREPHADGYELPVASLKHIQHRTQQTTSYQTRLFRNDERYRFRYRIHEMITPAILEHNGVVERISVVIHHDGYDCSEEEMQQKMLRNLPALIIDAEEYPDNLFLQKRLAQTHLVLGNAHESFSILHKTIQRIEQQHLEKIHPLSCGYLYVLYADVLMQQKKYSEAEAAALQSLQHVPQQNFAHYVLSQLYEAQARYTDAITHINQILPSQRDFQFGSAQQQAMAEEDVFPLKQDILHQRAVLYRKMKNFEAEKNDLAEVVRLAPHFTMGLFDYASALARDGSLKDALQFLQKAQTLEPKNASIYHQRGNIFFKLERYTEAYNNLKSAFTYGANDDALLLLLIRLSRELKKGAEAVPYCDCYLQRHSAAADILMELVQLLIQNNNVHYARTVIERSLPSLPDGAIRATIHEIYQKLYTV